MQTPTPSALGDAAAGLIAATALSLLLTLGACWWAPTQGASRLLLRMAQPGSMGRLDGAAALLGPLILYMAVAAELAIVPPDAWFARVVGTRAVICLTYVPSIAAVPLAVILATLRRRPRLGTLGRSRRWARAPSGFVLRRAVSRPLAVVRRRLIPLSIAIVALAGSAIGSRILRW